jgi:uncharacterized protein (PEP-CTERM system associated)
VSVSERASARRINFAWRVTVLAGLPLVMVCNPAGAWDLSASARGKAAVTDNVRLAPGGHEESGMYMQVSPGLYLSNDDRHLKVTAAYSPTFTYWPFDTEIAHTDSALSAHGRLEAFDEHFFVDADASISQQLLTPFGSSSVDTGYDNSNQVESRTFGISPYFRGKIEGDKTYDLRHKSSWTSTNSDLARTNYLGNWSASVDSGVRKLGWNLSYTRTDSELSNQAAFTDEILRATLRYQADPELTLHARMGFQSNNYSLNSSGTTETYGAGLFWNPTARTQWSASWDHYFFGEGYSLGITHRLRRGFISVNAGRNASATSQAVVAGDEIDVAAQFDYLAPPSITDPQQRRQYVLGVLAQLGIPATIVQLRNIRTTRATLSEFFNASYSIQGINRTLAFSVFWRDTQSIDDTLGILVPEALSLSSNSTQRGAAMTYSQALSGKSFMNLTLSRTLAQSSGASSSNAESTQDTMTGTLTHKLTGKTSGSAGLRYSHLNSNTVPGYTEHSVFATVSHNF